MPIYAFEDFTPILPAKDRFWVAPDAQVVGRVKIGVDVSIWFGVVIRADNDVIEIGDGSNIQDGSVLHADPGFPLTIGAGCTIGHQAMLHGCTLGPGTLVGMGATLLNGAKIGANCLIGANALVTEGKEFPDNSLILGSPAKEARPLGPEALANMRRAQAGYVERWRRFKAGLRQVD